MPFAYHAISLLFLCSCLLLSIQLTLSWCCELHADRQPGVEEAGLPVPDELRQKSARYGHHGCQQLCEGNLLPRLIRKWSSTVAVTTSPLSVSLCELLFISAFVLESLGCGCLSRSLLNPIGLGPLSLPAASYCRGDDLSVPVSGYGRVCSRESYFYCFTNHH